MFFKKCAEMADTLLVYGEDSAVRNRLANNLFDLKEKEYLGRKIKKRKELKNVK